MFILFNTKVTSLPIYIGIKAQKNGTIICEDRITKGIYGDARFIQFGTVYPRYTLTTGTTVEPSMDLIFINTVEECYLSTKKDDVFLVLE